MTNIHHSRKLIANKQQLIEDYLELKTLSKVSIKYNVSVQTVANNFLALGIPYKTVIKHTCDDSIFSLANEKSYYTAGFIAADGCISKAKHKKNVYILNVSLSFKDKDHLEKIKSILKTNAPIRDRAQTLQFNNKSYKISSLQVTSKQIFNDLLNIFNITPKKSLTLKFPSGLDQDLIHHFIRGYFDGDGCVYIREPKTSLQTRKVELRFAGTKDMLDNISNIIYNI